MSDSYPPVYQAPMWISHKYICLQIETQSSHLYPPRPQTRSFSCLLSHKPPALPPALTVSESPSRLLKRTGHQIDPSNSKRPSHPAPSPRGALKQLLRDQASSSPVHVHTAASSLLPSGNTVSMRGSYSPAAAPSAAPQFSSSCTSRYSRFWKLDPTGSRSCEGNFGF